MSTIYPSLMNNNFEKTKTHNCGKSEIQCMLCPPYVHQEPNILRNNKGANIIVRNIPSKLFNFEAECS